jgi:hypothetical protein
MLGFGEVHLAPIVLDLLDGQIVATLLPQKLCVSDRSEAAIDGGGGHGRDHLALGGGQLRFAAHDLPHEVRGVAHRDGIEAV